MLFDPWAGLVPVPCQIASPAAERASCLARSRLSGAALSATPDAQDARRLCATTSLQPRTSTLRRLGARASATSALVDADRHRATLDDLVGELCEPQVVRSGV